LRSFEKKRRKRRSTRRGTERHHRNDNRPKEEEEDDDDEERKRRARDETTSSLVTSFSKGNSGHQKLSLHFPFRVLELEVKNTRKRTTQIFSSSSSSE